MTITAPPAPQLPAHPVRVLMPQLDWPNLSARASQLHQSLTISDYGPEFTPLERVTARASWCSALPDYAAIVFSGQDAQGFLQGQLTNDVAALAVHDTQLSGYCTPKGRLLATGWLLRSAEQEYTWIVSSPLAQALAKRLKMYVMRSKVGVDVCLDSHQVIGVHACPPVLQAALEQGPWSILHLPVQRMGANCLLLCVALPDLIGLWERLLVEVSAQPSHWWRGLEIRAGLARITAATSELFVPQMVNFELTGGVSFKKGCYPGQEIVARSQYLGKLKRRMVLTSKGSGEAPPPGADVWAQPPSADSVLVEPIGQVVAAAELPEGTFCLIETSQAQSDNGFYVRSADGSVDVLTPQALPYLIEKIA